MVSFSEARANGGGVVNNQSRCENGNDMTANVAEQI
jgi:hypothetical protein